MNTLRQGLKQLLIAIACSGLALAARLSLDSLLGSLLPYTFALGGVALSVYLGSWKAGIVSALVSALWVNYFYIIPKYEFEHLLNVPLVASLISYCGISAILVIFGARASKALAEQTKAKEDTQRALGAADRANEAWRIADKQKDEFISILSHELRNPLGAISNATLVIRERSRGSPLSPAVELLYRQVEQMRRLLDDLLDVARINRGLLALHRRSQDVRLCVQNAIDANAHLIEAAQQELEVGLPDGPVMLFIDGARITQIVSNLVNNAAKYAGNGARIEVRVEPFPKEVAITVRDNGAGIEAALLPHLFERFHADAKERAIQGLGLGLWITQGLATMHGGRITAQSTGLGYGSVFTLHLPIEEVSCDSLQEPAQSVDTPSERLS